MLASITPFGERARNNRFAVTATAFVVASALGGLVTGALFGLAGAALFAVVPVGDTARLVVALGVVVAAALVDLGIGGVRLPTTKRQVDERWLTQYRGWVYGVGFGFQLGLGLVTVVTSAAIYAAFEVAVLTGSFGAGAFMSGSFEGGISAFIGFFVFVFAAIVLLGVIVGPIAIGSIYAGFKDTLDDAATVTNPAYPKATP